MYLCDCICMCRHCWLPGLPGVSSESEPVSAPKSGSSAGKAVVLVAKHLCGAATDLALSALAPLVQGEGGEGGGGRQVGVCVATCCHHACGWADLSRGTRAVLMAWDICEAEFDQLRRLVIMTIVI